MDEPIGRPGERTLTVLATPLNLLILRVLAERPMRLAELRAATGLPAQTTLRGHLASLNEIGLVDKRPTQQMPYSVENELTPMGGELLEVADILEAWLAGAPDGPIALESGAAKGVIKAFVDGWGSTIIRGLAWEPMSLTELDRGIPDLSYPALERRLASMRMAGLIEARPGRGVGTPYTVTDWARRGVGPLAAAGKCELLYMRNRPPITEVDVEAAFMLAIPLVGMPMDVAGACQLGVEVDSTTPPAGVTVRIERGRVVACDSGVDDSAGQPFAIGPAAKWFSAIVDGNFEDLSFGGAPQLAEGLVRGLHSALRGQ